MSDGFADRPPGGPCRRSRGLGPACGAAVRARPSWRFCDGPVPFAAAQTMTTPKGRGLPGWCRGAKVTRTGGSRACSPTEAVAGCRSGRPPGGCPFGLFSWRAGPCYGRAPCPPPSKRLRRFCTSISGELDGGREGESVWLSCSCGASIAQPISEPHRPPAQAPSP